ncbi:MAG: glycosyltransferase [Gemmobacter sp.]|jgi:GT2 family glycosyltransferase|nr:glycosyltransferase [Gemmobacter sp.]
MTASPASQNIPLRLCAVVVTYNRVEHLRLTVERLLAEPLDHLVVVDNGSADGSREWLRSVTDPRLCLVESPVNGGGAAGFEMGLREAVARFDPDWIVVMDDDARPAPGALAAFRAGAARFATEEWEAVAAGVRFPQGPICEMNRPSRNPFWHIGAFLRTALGGGRAGFHVPDADYGSRETLPIDAASFVGLFLSRAAIRRAGYPDGRLFIYGDDVLYTLGLSRRGGRIGFAPWIVFQHDCGTFAPDGGRTYYPLWKVYYNYRNGLLAYREAAGPLLFWSVAALVVPKWAMTAGRYGKDRRAFLRLLRLAVRDGVLQRRAVSQADVWEAVARAQSH